MAPEEKRYLSDIEKLIKRSIPLEALPGYSAERYESSPSPERAAPRSRDRERERPRAKPEVEETKEYVQEKRPEIPALDEAPVSRRVGGRKKEVAALLLPRRSVPAE